MGINSWFFYEIQKFRPQGPFVYISDFFAGVKVKFFRFISKQMPYLVFLNTLVIESITISWESIVDFCMKFKNFPLRWTLCKHLRFFRGYWIFSLYTKTNTVFVLSKYSCIRIDKNILGINSWFFYVVKVKFFGLYRYV